MKQFLTGVDIVDGPFHYRDIVNGVGNILTIDTTTRQVTERTPAQILADIGAQALLTNPVTGTGVAGRLALWSGTSTLTTDAELSYDGVDNTLIFQKGRILQTSAHAGASFNLRANRFNFLVLSAIDNTLDTEHRILVSEGQNLRLFTQNTERWVVNTLGALLASSAQTIGTATGSLLISTGAANGDITLSPHGNGNVIISSSTSGIFDINRKILLNTSSFIENRFNFSSNGLISFYDVAHAINNVNTAAGNIKIMLPDFATAPSTMMLLKVWVYDYASLVPYELIINLYNFGTNQFASTQVSVNYGSASQVSQVRFGRTDTTRPTIFIDYNTNPSYTKVILKEVSVSHGSANNSVYGVAANYSIQVPTTDETGYVNTLTVTRNNFITDVNLVNTHSNQTIAGIKTFTSVGALQSTGLATSYGTTSGINTGAFNAIMGTSTSATWLLSGTSGGTFRYGIQGLDAGGVLRIYSGTSFVSIINDTITATTFNGTLNGNALTANTLQTGRTLTVGATGKTFNGSANVAWSLSEIGAAPDYRSDIVNSSDAVHTYPVNWRGIGNSVWTAGATGFPTVTGVVWSFIGLSQATPNSSGYPRAFDLAYSDGQFYLRRLNPTTGLGETWQRMYLDNYHPDADKWTTPRTITIGSTGKSLDGSANVSWNLTEIGAEPIFSKGNVVQGGGISLTGTLTSRLVGSGDITITHEDTSAQASITNTNGTIIQSIGLDTYGHVTSAGSLDGDSRWSRLIDVLNNLSTWSHVPLQNGIDFVPYTTGSSGYPSTLGFAVAFYASTSDSTSGFGRAFALNRAYNTENYYIGSPNTSGVHNGWRLIYHSGNLNISNLNGTSGILGVPNGGTGIGSYTTGNYIKASSSTTLTQVTPAQMLIDLGIKTSAIHNQTVASTTWTFTHNLNTDTPLVTVWVDNKMRIPSDVEVTSVNTIIITFSEAVAGRAIAAGGNFANINTLESNSIIDALIF